MEAFVACKMEESRNSAIVRLEDKQAADRLAELLVQCWRGVRTARRELTEFAFVYLTADPIHFSTLGPLMSCIGSQVALNNRKSAGACQRPTATGQILASTRPKQVVNNLPN